ncbi:MAG: VIT1/CCC1 transporter family protein [Burkholderiaceae bacterium]|nr:VIT1/CCC1 transporter family protein [Burkholderiaceae bacterium]
MLDGYVEEERSAMLYDALAEIEGDPKLSAMFAKLASAARHQADIWGGKIEAAGGARPSPIELGLSARTALVLARKLGIRAVRQMLAAQKVRGLSAYSPSPVGGHGPVGRSPEFIGRRHHTGSGNLRAAVFGINDGLVSNTSLILGMAGAASDSRTLLLTGIAGLLAGAFSMAAGEYVSVRSQREVFEYQIGLEAAELREYPEEEAQELAVIFEAKGLEHEEATRLANTLIADPERALDTLAREELGLNPDELGSPWGAASASFAAFAIGALVPLLPFVLTKADIAFPTAAVLAGFALFGVGAALSMFTGRSAILSGLRMLGIGAGAGAATYAIGALIGGGIPL